MTSCRGLPILIVAVTPRLFRDALGRAIVSLRPGLRTIAESPDGLRSLDLAMRPVVVIADESLPIGGGDVPVWVCLSRMGQSHCTITVRGVSFDVGNIGLTDMLDLIDIAIGVF